MASFDADAVTFIRDVKTALNVAADQLQDAQLTITQVDLELQTTVTTTGGAEISVKLLSLDASREEEVVDTISLTLVPRPAPRRDDLVEPMSDELSNAITLIAAACSEASSSPPAMDLRAATVALSVGMTREGKVSVVLTGSRERENSHTLRLSLAPTV
ncbi:MAG: trypco2 family protein [Mycobacteriales bacterium]